MAVEFAGNWPRRSRVVCGCSFLPPIEHSCQCLAALLARRTALTLFWLALYFLMSLSVLKPAGSLYGNSQLGPFQQMSAWLQQLFSSALLWHH